MQSLSDLNNYSQTTITFDDDRNFGVVFNITTPIDQTSTVFENQTATLTTGIEILEIVDPVICDVVYEIDMTTVGVDVDLNFGTLPAGVTVTESPSNFWTVDGIDSEVIWNQIKSPIATFPFGTTGTATFSTTIEYTQEDSTRATKDTNYTVTITAINYMSTPGAETFAPYETGYNPLVPSITVDTGVFNPIFTMTISPDNLVAIDEMRVTTPDSAVFTSSTDTLVINGEKDEINSSLATLEIDFTGVNQDFTLTYKLTNNLNSDVDIVIQEFVSDEFAAVVDNTFSVVAPLTEVLSATAAPTMVASIAETSTVNNIAEVNITMTATMTGQPDGIDRAATTTNANTFSASAFGNTPIVWEVTTLGAHTLSVFFSAPYSEGLYVNAPGITSGNVTMTGPDLDFPSAGTYEIQVGTLDGSNIEGVTTFNDFVPTIASTTAIKSFGELTNGRNTLRGFRGDNCSQLPDRINSDMTNLNAMFENAFNLSVSNAIPSNIDNWDTSNITQMTETFKNAGYDATSIPDISSWDVSNVQFMRSMFEDSSFNRNIGSWDTGNVTDMSSMFKDATNFNYSLNSWDMANVTTIENMFNGATSYNQPVNNWTLTDLTNMTGLFLNASSFNSNPNFTLPSGITSLQNVFALCTVFNQAVTWNVSNITNFGGLFSRAEAFNQDLSGWNIKTNQDVSMSGLFYGASSFNNSSLNSWDTSAVTNMSYMFATYDQTNPHNFNQDISGWDVGSVGNFNHMFYDGVFNQDIGSWDTSSAYDMRSMFEDNTVFDQDISSWDVSGVNAFGQTDFDTNTNVNWTAAEKPTFT